METIYDVDYFIRKFEAIPDESIGTGDLNRKCALYHCGITGNFYPNQCDATEEIKAIIKLFGGDPELNDTKDFELIWRVNDGIQECSELGNTPKQRILAALYDIKAKQQPAEPKEKIIYKTVVIDTAVQKLQKQLTEN